MHHVWLVLNEGSEPASAHQPNHRCGLSQGRLLKPRTGRGVALAALGRFDDGDLEQQAVAVSDDAGVVGLANGD